MAGTRASWAAAASGCLHSITSNDRPRPRRHPSPSRINRLPTAPSSHLNFRVNSAPAESHPHHRRNGHRSLVRSRRLALASGQLELPSSQGPALLLLPVAPSDQFVRLNETQKLTYLSCSPVYAVSPALVLRSITPPKRSDAHKRSLCPSAPAGRPVTHQHDIQNQMLIIST